MRRRGPGPIPQRPAPPPRVRTQTGQGADAGDSTCVRAIQLFQHQWQAWSPSRTRSRPRRQIRNLPA
eukprot:6200878-Pyramimonas_sp.AAC.1